MYNLFQEPVVKRIKLDTEENDKMDTDEQQQQNTEVEPTVTENTPNEESVIQEKTVEVVEQPTVAAPEEAPEVSPIVSPAVTPTRGRGGRGRGGRGGVARRARR